MQLSICHQRATESDSTNVGAKVCHYLGEVSCRVRGEVWVLDHVFSDTGEHGSQPHQAVEGCHQLGQITDLDLLSNGQTLRVKWRERLKLQMDTLQGRRSHAKYKHVHGHILITAGKWVQLRRQVLLAILERSIMVWAVSALLLEQLTFN